MEVERVGAEEQNRLTQKRFEAAVKVIKSLPPNGPFQPSNDMMLKFYSYYKQATIGPCNIPRPGFWDVVGKAKWDAWNSLGEMSEEEAMAAYVDQMKLILEGMPMTDEVEELLRILGPFYELIDEKKKITQISDLSTGFGTMLNSMESKSVAKSVIRNMEMNGTLETRPARLRQNEEVEQEEEDEDDEEEEGKEDAMEIRKATQPKKKISTRRHKASLQNGKLSNGGSHLANGSHQRADNEQDASAREPLTNGHHAGPRSFAPGSQLHPSGDGAEPAGPVPPRGSLDEQIVVALARVQEDIQSVLERMGTVEALTANLARSVTLPSYGSPPGNKRNRNPSWWPFDISPTSLAFAVIWPFVVQWLIRLYFQKRRRRIN